MIAFSDRDFARGEIIGVSVSMIKSASSEDHLLALPGLDFLHFTYQFTTPIPAPRNKKTKFLHHKLLDIDECKRDLDNCHSDATCFNQNGTFQCSCGTGYEGNGTYCTGTNIISLLR